MDQFYRKRYKLIGGPGCGKTTCAFLLAKNRGHLSEFNASDERGIDVVREKIKHLALSTQEQIIFLDEAVFSF